MKGKTKPTRCPQCRDKDFEISYEEPEDEMVEAECVCNSCQFTWFCEYSFDRWRDADDD